VLSIAVPAVRNARRPRDKRGSFAESILDDDTVADIEAKHTAIDALPDPVTGVVRTPDELDVAPTRPVNPKENQK
jgi:putative tricarboxylic transport membrane protein